MNNLALVGLAVILAFSEPSQPPPPTPLPTAEIKQQTGETHTPVTKPTAETAGAIKNCYHANSQGDTSDKESSSNRAIAWLTGVLAFAALVQIAVTVVQARYMHLTRRSYEKGERAALWLDDVKFFGVYEKGVDEIRITYDLVNTGRTSGDVYEQRMTMTSDIPDGAELPKQPPYEGTATPVHFTVASGRHLFRQMGFKKADFPSWSEVEANRRNLYLFGYIRYRDAFDVPHVTRFGIRYRDGNVSITSEAPGYNIDV